VKAVWYERTGPAAEVLTFGEMPTPVVGPGEVRIRLEASGVNPADVGRRGGSYRAMEYPRVIPTHGAVCLATGRSSARRCW
jgi:NADPH2:quinone reductase